MSEQNEIPESDKHVEAKSMPDQIDPTALSYAIVRDATFLNPDIPPTVAISVLELVKAECIRTLQKGIDEKNEAMRVKREETSPSHIKLED